MSLFGKDATSFSHLDLGILCHSSLQIISSSVRLDGKRWWTAIFRSLQRCSIGFKSGLWLGHSRTVTELLWSHSFVILAVCLGSMGLIYQSNVETSADPSAQINLRQSSRVIYETFVCRQSHRTKDRTLINVAAENNRHLNITPLKTPQFRSLAPRVYDKE